MIAGRKISVQAVTALLAAFAALVLLAAAPSPAAAAPSYAWAIKGGGTGLDHAYGVSALPDGSSIITGYFGGTVTFGTTPPLISTGLNDTFTAKVNADGIYAWAIRGGGTDYDQAYGVSALPDGSSIITGAFNGTATFGTTPPLTSTGSNDTFTAKVNADGTYAWAIRGGGTLSDHAYGVSALPDGSSIITGTFRGTATFGTTPPLISTGGEDTFTAKVNADGTYAWATQAGGTSYDIANGVSVLPDGSSIITGYFAGTAVFGSTTLISTGSSDTFTAKVNANGTYAWAIRGGGTGNDYGKGVSVLPDGSSIITGYFNGTATFGTTTLTSTVGSNDTFTAKVNANGSYAWAIRGGGTGDDQANGVSALLDGSSIITGSFNGTATFGTTTLTSTGLQDTFTAKVNADGSYAWAIRGGGTGDDFARGVSALLDGSSSIITGSFNGTATFGTTPPLISTGSYDSFTARILPPVLFDLAVTKSGTGAGTVTSSPAGINCGADCSESLVDGSSVTLTASPTAGSSFAGWSGSGCSGTSTCTVVMSEARAVNAEFAVVPPVPPVPPALFDLAVTKSGTGAGTVTSSPAGINCGADCSESLVDGSSVTLTAKPTTGSSFVGWSGAGCSGTSTCTVIMSEARAVDAKFTKRPSNVFPTPTVTVDVNALTSTVVVPGPGKLTQRVTRTAAVLTVCKTSRKATKAGTVKLTCKLNAATRAALRKRSLRVRVKTTFTPTGGSSASKTQAVTLKSQRPPPYTG